MAKPIVGGQAVLEGVLMRNGEKVAVAVRKANGKIKIKKEKFKGFFSHPFFKQPFVRGIVSLIDTLVLGIRALNYSANEMAEEEGEKMTGWQIFSSIAFSFIFAILLFLVLPLFLTGLITKSHGVLFNLIDGIIRIFVFVLYIVIISLMSDVRRVFQYHGAEHKSVHCFEAKLPLTAKNAKKFSCLHPRCGTTFVLMVLVISVLIFSLFVHPSWMVKFLVRIVFIPVIAGISFELLHLSAIHINNRLVRAIISPGLMLQKLTTREPNLKQLEVAIAALKAVT